MYEFALAALNSNGNLKKKIYGKFTKIIKMMIQKDIKCKLAFMNDLCVVPVKFESIVVTRITRMFKKDFWRPFLIIYCPFSIGICTYVNYKILKCQTEYCELFGWG